MSGGHQEPQQRVGICICGGIDALRVLADGDAALQLYAQAQRTLRHCELHAAAAQRVNAAYADGRVAQLLAEAVGPAQVALACDFLAASWMGRQGCAGQNIPQASYGMVYGSKGGNCPAAQWRRVAASIPAWHERLRNVDFCAVDALELIARLEDDPRQVMYVDPPYLDAGKKYRHGMDEAQHRRLAEVLNAKRQTRIFYSCYRHELLEELYPPDRWDYLVIGKSGAFGFWARAGDPGRAAEPKDELLLCSGANDSLWRCE